MVTWEETKKRKKKSEMDNYKKANKNDLNLIPKSLHNNDFKFILVEPKGKKPFEKSWQKNNNYNYNNEKLINHIKNGGNYGVATGYNNLIVIDYDNEEYQNKLMELLPETFTVKTGGGLNHAYYFIDNPKAMKILDDNKDTILDFQGKGKQVIGAGSTHPNGNKYKIINDIQINNITLAEIKAIFFKVFPKEWLPKDMKKQTDFKDFNKNNKSDTVWEIKKQYSIKQLLSEQGINTNNNPTKCPLHDSKGGACLGFNDDVWNCFHCEEKGDVISLYQLIYNLDFKQALKELCEKLNIEYKPFKQNNDRFVKGLGATTDRLQQIEDFIEENPVYYDRSKIWWFWNFDDNKWEIVDEYDILSVVEEELNFRNIIKTKIKNEVIDGLKLIGRRKKPKDPPINWIQFKNYIYDINTGDKFKPTSEYFFTNPIQWNLGEDHKTPNMTKLFNDWVGEKNVPLLYEIIAYCLYRDYPIHRIFCLIGVGRNGKSKFLELINRFIGADNRTSSELDTLIENRFESAKLYRKLACVLSETNYNAIKKSGLLKKLSGQDLIGYEFKNKNPFDDYNYAKILIATNGLPITHDKTDGFYRRWLILEFPNQFPEGKDILATIPKEEYENLCLKSVKLLNKILKKGTFTNELTIDEKKKMYERKSNPIMTFIEDCCDINSRYDVAFFKLYDYFKDFCNEYGHREISKRKFSQVMKDEGFDLEKRNVLNDNDEKTTWNFLIGLKIKNTENTENTEN